MQEHGSQSLPAHCFAVHTYGEQPRHHCDGWRVWLPPDPETSAWFPAEDADPLLVPGVKSHRPADTGNMRCHPLHSGGDYAGFLPLSSSPIQEPAHQFPNVAAHKGISGGSSIARECSGAHQTGVLRQAPLRLSLPLCHPHSSEAHLETVCWPLTRGCTVPLFARNMPVDVESTAAQAPQVCQASSPGTAPL